MNPSNTLARRGAGREHAAALAAAAVLRKWRRFMPWRLGWLWPHESSGASTS
jgi:hypothetical protein